LQVTTVLAGVGAQDPAFAIGVPFGHRGHEHHHRRDSQGRLVTGPRVRVRSIRGRRPAGVTQLANERVPIARRCSTPATACSASGSGRPRGGRFFDLLDLGMILRVVQPPTARADLVDQCARRHAPRPRPPEAQRRHRDTTPSRPLPMIAIRSASGGAAVISDGADT
jgi:hypothetical protein